MNNEQVHYFAKVHLPLFNHALRVIELPQGGNVKQSEKLPNPVLV